MCLIIIYVYMHALSTMVYEAATHDLTISDYFVVSLSMRSVVGINRGVRLVIDRHQLASRQLPIV